MAAFAPSLKPSGRIPWIDPGSLFQNIDYKEEAVEVLPLGLLDLETTNLKCLSSCVSSVSKSSKGH